MDLPRRDLAALLPLLAAHIAQAQPATLPTRTFPHEGLPVRDNPNGNKSRAIFDGLTTGYFPIELHETELAPGNAPHPPHKHEHVELLLVRDGTVEVTIDGAVTVLTAGSVAYVAPNAFHGWKNIGGTRAAYFVMALGRKRA